MVLEGGFRKMVNKELNRIRKLYEKTHFYCSTDPEVALAQARKSAEAICKSIYVKTISNKGKPVEKMMLDELIKGLTREGILPKSIGIHLRTIQEFGNFGVHDQGEESELISPEYIQPCFSALGTVFSWYLSSFQSDYQDLDSVSKLSLSPPLEARDSECDSKDLLVVVGNHAPPSRIFDGEEVTGIYFDIMRAISKKIGLKVSYEKASFDQSLKLLKRGKAHVFVGPNKTPEREKDFIYSKHPLPKVMKVFYASLDSKPICSKKDLYERTLIVMKQANYNSDFSSDPRLLKVEVSNYDTGVTLVQKDPKYVLIMPEVQGDYLLDEMDVDLMKSPYKIEGEDSYIVYSKQLDPLHVESIEKAFMDLMDEGIYQRILGMY